MKRSWKPLKSGNPPLQSRKSSYSPGLQTFTGNPSQTSPTLSPPLIYLLIKGNPGSGLDSNRKLSNTSNISSPPHQSSKSQMPHYWQPEEYLCRWMETQPCILAFTSLAPSLLPNVAMLQSTSGHASAPVFSYNLTL